MNRKDNMEDILKRMIKRYYKRNEKKILIKCKENNNK